MDHDKTRTVTLVMVMVTQKSRDTRKRDECSGLEVLQTHLLLPCIGDTGGGGGTSFLVIARESPVGLGTRLIEFRGSGYKQLSFPETVQETGESVPV